MRERRISDRDGYLLDDADDDDVSSTSSEPGDCNWLVLAGIFLIQLVISGVLASYGVLLVCLVEDTEVTIREAIWIPAVYTASWCLADPICKKVSDRRHAHGARLLTAIGVVVIAGGVASSTLLHSSGLQILGYGFLGGLGTSLVLIQAEITLYCHYPVYSRSAGLPHCVPQLGSALAQFAMPLILLGFVSAYGAHGAPLLQSGLILQGLLGALTFVSPARRTPNTFRYSSRLRAITFISNETQSINTRDNYINNSYSGGSSFTSTSSSSSWRNSPPSMNRNEVLVSKNIPPPNVTNSPICIRNQFGVDILPEIPEESEDEADTDYSTCIEDVHPNKRSVEATIISESKSMDSSLDTTKEDRKLSKEPTNKRWSIGTVEDMMAACVDNLLVQDWTPLGNSSSNSKDTKNTFSPKSMDSSIGLREWEGIMDVSTEKQKFGCRPDTLRNNGVLLAARSLGEISSNVGKKDLSDFDPISNKCTNITNIHNTKKRRKVRSLEDVVPVFGKSDLKNQKDISVTNVVPPKNEQLINDDIKKENFRSDFEETLTSGEKSDIIFTDSEKVLNSVRNLKQSDKNQNNRERWSLGSLDEVVYANGAMNMEYPKVNRKRENRKRHSVELGDINSSVEQIELDQKFNPCQGFEICVQNHSPAVQENEDSDSFIPSSPDSEHPLWAAKLMSSENVREHSASSSFQDSISLRRWTRNSTLGQVLRRLKDTCTCQYYQRRRFRRSYPENRALSRCWSVLGILTIPYLFPSMLVRFAIKFCPMGFAALTPSLARHIRKSCTLEEAVFSVSISGFVWLCFLLLTPWCAKMPPNKRKYLYAAGNVVAAFGLHFLSRADSHDKVTLSCAIFGLGHGATMVSGNTVIREALGTWNLSKVDVFLDLTSGILVLITAVIMGEILKDREGLPSCFTLLAVVHLVTGISWLVRPLLTSLRCRHQANSDWPANGNLLHSS